MRSRLLLLRRRWRLMVRLVLSTVAAYVVATYVFGHSQAFFAPMAAIIGLTAGGLGVRGRVAVELVVGVAFGVLVGEALIILIGRGWWQIGFVAALTMIVATLVGIRGLALTQALNSAVLLVAIAPIAGNPDPAISRALDALIGGAFGLLATVLIPRNSVRDIDREVRGVLLRLSAVLARTADALRENDPALAQRALDQARSTQSAVDAMRATATSATEIARISPMRWRQRDLVVRYFGSTAHLDHAIRDARVLARRVAAMLRNGEVAPPGLATAIDMLAAATRGISHELASDQAPVDAQDDIVASSHLAIDCLASGITVNSAAIAAQVRSLAADLLLATGLQIEALDDLLDRS